MASGFLGMFVGANVLSVLADRLGRRRVFLLNLLTYSLFSLLAAFSPNIETFLVLRFLAGIGLGAELVLVDTYLAEFLPARVRGRYIAWAYTVGFLGVPVAALLGGKLVAAQEIAGVDGLALAARRGLARGAVRPRHAPRAAGVAAVAGVPRAVRGVRASRAARSPRRSAPRTALDAAPTAPPRTRPSGARASTGDVLRIAFTDYRKRTVMLVRLPGPADGRLLRVRHAGAAGAGEQGLRGHRVARLRRAELRRLPDRLAALGAAGGAVRAQVPHHRVGARDRRVRHRVRGRGHPGGSIVLAGFLLTSRATSSPTRSTSTRRRSSRRPSAPPPAASPTRSPGPRRSSCPSSRCPLLATAGPVCGLRRLGRADRGALPRRRAARAPDDGPAPGGGSLTMPTTHVVLVSWRAGAGHGPSRTSARPSPRSARPSLDVLGVVEGHSTSSKAWTAASTTASSSPSPPPGRATPTWITPGTSPSPGRSRPRRARVVVFDL